MLTETVRDFNEGNPLKKYDGADEIYFYFFNKHIGRRAVRKILPFTHTHTHLNTKHTHTHTHLNTKHHPQRSGHLV